MKKKLIFAIAIGFFAVATVFNMNMLQSNDAGDFSLEGIAVMAQAQNESLIPWSNLYHIEYLGNSGMQEYWIGGSQMQSETHRDQQYTKISASNSISTNGNVVTLASNISLEQNSGTLTHVSYRCGWAWSGTCDRAGERDFYRF